MSKNIETYSAAAESGNVYKRRSRWDRFRLAARKSPYTARFGVIVICIYVLVALFAPLLAPYGEAEVFPSPLSHGAPLIFLALTRLAETFSRG